MGRVYVNIEDRNEIVAFDSRTLKVQAHWTLAGCESPTGLAIDAKAKRLFAGCENQVLVVLSTGDGRSVAKLPSAGVRTPWLSIPTRISFSARTATAP